MKLKWKTNEHGDSKTFSKTRALIGHVYRSDNGWTFSHIYTHEGILFGSADVFFDTREEAEALCTAQIARFQKRLSV